MENNTTNRVWQSKLEQCLDEYDHIVEPRGMEVREVINGGYEVDMPSFIDLQKRGLNTKFMFGEAAWIVSGSNSVEDITQYMKRYKDFSDDGVFMRGAYGPKVVDQLGYVVDSLENDRDSRQSVMTIWRERPGSSKDIPCTVAAQFFVRDNKVDMITTMRSQDIVYGFTYDVFTFSMIAKSVELLLRERGIKTGLGKLAVNVGSMHIYKHHYDKAHEWIESTERDETISKKVERLASVETYNGLIKALRTSARLEK